MKLVHAVVTLALLTTATACGSGYDAEEDCTQSIACCQELGDPADTGLDACIDNSEEFFDSLTDEQQEAADAAFDRCEGRTGCDFIACASGEEPTACGL